MMSAFGLVESTSSSSVEALAFNYLGYGLLGLVNNLWTLVALLTAAVSFWRFNILPSLARRHHLLKLPSSSVVLAETHPQQTSISSPIDSDQSTSATAVPLPKLESSNYTKLGKCNRVYSRFCYNDDDVVFQRQDEAEEEEIRSLRINEEEHQTLRFDVIKRLRLSDLGFYDYQDMRVLNGNVVKLWDSNSRSGRRC